jgi:hypothetical protein
MIRAALILALRLLRFRTCIACTFEFLVLGGTIFVLMPMLKATPSPEKRKNSRLKAT